MRGMLTFLGYIFLVIKMNKVFFRKRVYLFDHFFSVIIHVVIVIKFIDMR